MNLKIISKRYYLKIVLLLIKDGRKLKNNFTNNVICPKRFKF